MPIYFTKLTRRRDPDRPDCWHVYCDIRAGTIAKTVGLPNAHRRNGLGRQVFIREAISGRSDRRSSSQHGWPYPSRPQHHQS